MCFNKPFCQGLSLVTWGRLLGNCFPAGSDEGKYSVEIFVVREDMTEARLRDVSLTPFPGTQCLVVDKLKLQNEPLGVIL